MFKAVSLLVSFIFSISAFAQLAQKEDPRPMGSLLLKKIANELPAIDLVCNFEKCGDLRDKPLNPDQVNLLIKKKVIKDASELNPSSNSILWSASLKEYPYADLWKNTLGFPVNSENPQELGFEFNNESFNYINIKPDGFNNMTSIYVRSTRDQQFYNIRLGPLVHNNLLRKGILRKLGYFIPPLQYLKTFKVTFANFGTAKEDKIKLINDLYQKSKNPTDWITNLSNDTVVCIVTPPGDPDAIIITDADSDEIKKIKQQQKDALIARRDQCNDLIAAIPDTFDVRGAVVYKGTDDISYNLSRGSLDTKDGPIIMGRRLLNSLLIPYAVVDAVPQLNLFEWVPGREQSQNISINHEEGYIYRVSLADSLWMLRRLAKLDRKDFVDIVKEAHFEIDRPEYKTAYENLLVEKLISRTTYLLKKFGVKTSLKAVTLYDVPGIVKDGKLLLDVCKDYLSIVCWESDPESPLSRREYFALGKSIFMSNAFSQAVRYANENVLPEEVQKGSSIGKALEYHRFVERPAKQFAKCLIAAKEGKQCTPLPDETWTHWYKNVSLIVSRNTVFGAFMGADYPIQLAKTVGFAVGGGMFAFRDGLPSDQNLTGDLNGSLLVTYTSLKGTLSVEAANKDPIKNIFVPSTRWKNRHILEDLSTDNLKKENIDLKLVEDAKASVREHGAVSSSIAEALEESPVQARVNEIISKFKESLGLQESVIISKIYGGSGLFRFVKSLKNELPGSVSLGDNVQFVSRLNVTRNRENTIQIFKSTAKMNTRTPLDMTVGYYGVPVIKGGFSRADGTAKTNFYSININPNIAENPFILDQIAALAKVLLTNNTSHLEKITENTKIASSYNPFKVLHSFHAPENSLGFLFWKRDAQKIMDTLTINTPDNFNKRMIMSTTGVRVGRDLQSFALDIINSLIQYKTNWDFDVSVQTNQNPGDTIYGRQRTRRASIEAQRNVDESIETTGKLNNLTDAPGELENQYGAIEHSWHGWQWSRKTLQKVVREQEERFGTDIYPEEKIQNIELAQLYTLLISVKFYKDAIDHMANLSPEAVREIFDKMSLDNIDIHGKYPNSGPRDTIPGRRKLDVIVENFVCAQEAYKIAKQAALGPDQVIRKQKCPSKEFRKPQPANPKMAANAALHMINRTEALLKKEGIWAMAGGKNEVYIEAYLDGFKKGDATGYKTVIGDSSGEITSQKSNGPLKDIMKAMDINVGEFYIYWLLNRL